MGELAKQFEELRIWQDARKMAGQAYQAFGVGSPAEKDFGFRDQIQRAAVSVMNNIAEGFERRSQKDFAHFLQMAKASCGEVRSMIYLAEDLSYIAPNPASEFRGNALRLSKSIEALSKTLRS